MSRGILGENLHPTGGISLHDSLQNNPHKNEVHGKREGETGRLLQTEVALRQPIAVSDISIYICLIDIRSHSEANPKNN